MTGVPATDPSTAARVAVIGGGAWGTTLAALAASAGPVTLWAREPDVVAAIRGQRRNEQFLRGFQLPASLEATSDVDAAIAGAEVVVVAVPAQHVRTVMGSAARSISGEGLIVSVTKGLEVHSSMRMSEVLAEVLPAVHPGRIGVLAGPNLAHEVMAGHPSATTVAFTEAAAATAVQARLCGPTFRVYTSDDVVGCEVGGSVKNVIAIAAGVAEGLGYGTNTLAALVTRGVAEMARLGVALGGDPMTFLGLAGNGDLVATCSSRLSRNHRVGRELAAGSTLEEILGTTSSVAEGVATAPVVVDLAGRHGVEMPIAETVVALLAGDVTPTDAIAMLMARDPRPELHGLRPHAAG